MRLRTYKAYTYHQAISAARNDLGNGVRVVRTRHVRKPGLIGFWSRPLVEVTVELSIDLAQPLKTQRAAIDARDAYGSSGRTDGDVPLDMELERLKTQRLAQALAAKLQQEGRVRTNTERNERAVSTTAALQHAMDKMVGDDARKRAASKVTPAPLPDVARRIVLQVEDQPERRLEERAALLGEDAPATRLVEEAPNGQDAIKRAVTRAIKEERSGLGTFGNAEGSNPAMLRELYARLLEQEVTEELARQLMVEVGEELGADGVRDPARVRRAARERIAAMLPIDEESLDVTAARSSGRPHVVALIGPTGVGKTTTIAKLAASARFRDGLSVGLLTTDSFRMAAVDQLRSYAEILQVPLEVVIEPEEMQPALDRLSACDVILIDSAGRSRHDEERLDVLKRFLAVAGPDETHLVLSATSGERTMLRDAEAFSALGADRVVLTKLDETDEFGVVLNVINKLGTRISFVTTGQEVPDDIERGGSDCIARMLLAGALVDVADVGGICESVT